MARRPYAGDAISEDYHAVPCCGNCIYSESDQMSCYVCTYDGIECPDFSEQNDEWNQWMEDHDIQSTGICSRYVPIEEKLFGPSLKIKFYSDWKNGRRILKPLTAADLLWEDACKQAEEEEQ